MWSEVTLFCRSIFLENSGKKRDSGKKSDAPDLAYGVAYLFAPTMLAREIQWLIRWSARDESQSPKQSYWDRFAS